MKYILTLLLLSSICNAQQQFKNFTKVTAYRLVNEDDEGACSLLPYMKNQGRVGYYLQAMQSFNDTIAYNLIQLKKSAKEWEQEDYHCTEGELNRTTIPNMFVVEINSYKDTIFTSCDNRSVYFPKEEKEFLDPSDCIISAFTKDIQDFHSRDFTSEIASRVKDSISTDKIVIGDKPVYGLTRKDFDIKITPFQMVTTDSIFNNRGGLQNIKQEFWLNNIKSGFGMHKKIRQITITNTEYKFPDTYAVYIDGIGIGDREEVLLDKYKNSTFFKNWGAPLNNINNYYYYEIKLQEERGNVTFYITDKIIKEIEINFWYREPVATTKKVPVK